MVPADALTATAIHLRPVGHHDLALLVAWRNDDANRCWFLNRSPLTIEGQEPWLNDLRADTARLLFIICRNADGVALGTVGLDRIDQTHRRAEFGNLLIGSTNDRRRGYASAAARLVIGYAFGGLAMHRVHLQVFVDNNPAIRLYERLGFVAEGVAREHHLADDRFRDILFMGCLKDEFKLVNALPDPQVIR